MRRLWLTVSLTVLVTPAVDQPLWGQRRAANVLTIHSGPSDHPANPVLDAGIRQGLQTGAGSPIEYFAEYLDFDRFSEVETTAAFSDYIARKYRGHKIHLVIASTNGGAQFALDQRARLFPHAPVVVAGAGLILDSNRALGAGITGVRVGRAYAETLKLALALHPATTQVHVIALSPSKGSVESVHHELRPLATRVRLNYIQADSMNALLRAVSAIPRGDLILYIWFHQAGPGHLVDPREPARRVSEASRVPVYGVSDVLVGAGIVGGLVRDTRGTGMRAGQMARRILEGSEPRDIPIEDAPLVPIFDWRQLQRWGIEAARLPSDADIRFRMPTPWEVHGRLILAGGIVVAGQLALIAALLTQSAKRRRAERAIRDREASLRVSYARIRRLAGGLINAQEAARVEIARDLHDDVCQDLVGVSMGIGALASSGRRDRAVTQQEFIRLQEWALALADRLRLLSHELHPATLQLLGLAAALKTHCSEVQKRHRVQVVFASSGDLGGLQSDAALGLFRIAQEALRNAAVHGAAHQIRVTLSRQGDCIELAVLDDGRGFDVESVARLGHGLGLVSIEERAHLARGDAAIVSRRGRGTAVVVRVPAALIEDQDGNTPAPTQQSEHHALEPA
jgi:signal transduction histidine kinase